MSTPETFHSDLDDLDLDPAEAEAIAIHEAVWLYQEGKLPADEAEKIKALISTDPRAAESLQACQQANAHAASPEGQTHMRQQLNLLQQRLVMPIPAPRHVRPVKRAAFSQPSSLWTRLKERLGFGDDASVPMGVALAQGKVPKRALHLGGQVVSLLSQDETRGWVLRLLTNNPDLTRLSYQFEGAEAKVAELEAQADGSFQFETVLEAASPPTAHPKVTCASK